MKMSKRINLIFLLIMFTLNTILISTQYEKRSAIDRLTYAFADNFEVKSDGQIAASIIKEKRKINDQYEIVNYEIEDDLFMVSLACICDNIFHG